MSDLVAFIRARLDEEKRNASEAQAQWTGTHFTIDPGSLVIVRFHREHDPARVLREVEAMRAILAMHKPEPMRYIEASRCPRCEVPSPCGEARALAGIWRDHPDYDPAWTP